MSDLLRSEWIKLVTVRVHRVLVIVAVAFAVVLTVLVTSLVSANDVFRPTELVDFVAGSTLVPIVLFASVAILGFTGEHGSGTLRLTYTATPRRSRVLGAKVVVSGVAVGVATALLVAVVWSVGAAIVAARGGDVGLSLDDGTVVGLWSVVGLAVAFSWFGLGVGLVVRNSPAAVTLFLLWPLVLENLLAGILFLLGRDGLVRWLPYQAALSSTGVDPGGDQLGRPWGLLWFTAVALALIAVGGVLERRRDA